MSASQSHHHADPSLSDETQLLALWQCDPARGLDSRLAARRLQEHGPNLLNSAPPLPGWRRFLRQFQDPLIYLLLAAIGITIVVWALEDFSGWPVDALVIATVVLLNALLGFLQENKAENAAAALARMTEVMATVQRDGRPQRIASSALVPGDILLLAEGDAIGADARLLQAHALRVQEASLTGESEAVLKQAVTLTAPVALGDRINMVFKGTAVAGGSGLALVTATGMQTEMGQIADMLSSTHEEETPLQKEVARLGRMLGIIVIAVALLVIVTLLLLGNVHTLQGLMTVLLFGVSLAVAAVPEGLPAVLSVVLAVGVQRLSADKAIVKKLSSVETLGSASVICSDKTGTLTRSEMTIERIVSASGISTVSGIGYAPEGEITHQGQALASQAALCHEQQWVLCGGSLASNATLEQDAAGQWHILGDPTEGAFLVAAGKLGAAGIDLQRFERLAELPFDSDRKLMSVVLREPATGRLLLLTKGAPDVLLQRCVRVQHGNAQVDLDSRWQQRFQAETDALSDAALRTLAVAWRELTPEQAQQADLSLEHGLTFAGVVGIIDPPRPEARQAIREAHQAGIRVIMITGDHPRTALRIAADLGIVPDTARVLTGPELDALLTEGEAAFAAAVREVSVYARVAPAHKLRIVDALQDAGHIVAMTGDGVNDAPALKSADIGIAMGMTGTEVTKEAARMILADDNFATIVKAVRIGRGIFGNIREFLRYLLSSNMGEVLTVFLGVVGAGVIGLNAGPEAASGALVLPLLATQILWINLITDSAPALALGMDALDDDVMQRPPRPASERVVDGRMWRQVAVTGLVMALSVLLTMDLFLPGGLLPNLFGSATHDLTLARTAGFTVLVMAQLFNCLNVRSEHVSAFHGLWRNGWLWAALALSLVLQVAVVELAWLNVSFGTTPMTLEQWLICIGMGSLVLWHGEIGKFSASM